MGGLIRPASSLLSAESVDTIVVIGDDESHLNSHVDDRTLRHIARLATTSIPLIGIGGGTLVLCKAGVMTNRKLCVSSRLHRHLVSEYPHHAVVRDRTFVVDGPRVTCFGNSGVTHLASYLVQKHLGNAVAQTNRLSAKLGLPLSRGVEDPRLHRCLSLMEANFSEPRVTRMICAEMGMSCRALERLFQKAIGLSPTEVNRRLRMRYALWLIENTDRRVLDIAFDSGFTSGAHFARAFRRFYGEAPVVRRARKRRGEATETGEHWIESRFSMFRDAIGA